MSVDLFGHTADGRAVERVTLSSGKLTVRILTLGAILQDVRLADVPYGLTLNADTVAPYEGSMAVFGALIGPVANRLGHGRALLDGATLKFDTEGGAHLLHSGSAGTQFLHWQLQASDETSATLALTLPDGAGGFPGKREIEAEYRVDGNTLTLSVEATTDRPTLVNFANHSYWNLDGGGTTEGHRLQVAADAVLASGDDPLPTGEIQDVAGTRFDYRTAKPVPASDHNRLDHNFCLARARGPLRTAAELTGRSGVRLTLETTEPGLQVFDGAAVEGAGFPRFGGVALEAQGWPDAPNHPAFPSIRLGVGETYRQVTRWTFRAP